MKGRIAMDRNIKIIIRTTPEKKAMIKHKAKQSRMNTSEYVRYSTLNSTTSYDPLYDQRVKKFLFHLENILHYLQNLNEFTLDTNTLEATFDFFYEEGKNLWLCLRSQKETTNLNKTSND